MGTRQTCMTNVGIFRVMALYHMRNNKTFVGSHIFNIHIVIHLLTIILESQALAPHAGSCLLNIIVY